MSETLAALQFTILTYIAAGFVFCKAGIITSEIQKNLSVLVVEVILPINVFASSLENLSVKLIYSFLPTLLLAVLIEIALIAVTKKPVKKFFGREEYRIVRYGLLVSNGGLVGAPVMEQLFGTAGVIMCNVLMIPTRIVTYSAGELIFGSEKKTSLFNTILKNKVIIVMAAALMMRTMHWNVPEPCFTALKNIGSCLSPLALVAVGSMMANCDPGRKEMSFKVVFASLLRLIVVPLFALGLCFLFSMDFMNTTVLVLLLGMPVGTTVAVHAEKYNGNVAFASAVVFVTTLASTASLILLLEIVEIFY